LSRVMVVHQPDHMVLDPLMMTWMSDSTFWLTIIGWVTGAGSL
jgi:hypothetical protein